MKDLFGQFVEDSKQNGNDYQQYINSPRWKKIRQAKLDAVGGFCERCGISKYSARLEVHHKDYNHFENERLEDLEVLCPDCHKAADAERQKQADDDYRSRKTSGSLVRGFENWMDRGNNKNWRRWSDDRLANEWKKFISILGKQTGRTYTAKFERNPEWE